MNNSPYAYQNYLLKTLNDQGLEGEEQAAQLLAAQGFVVYFDRAHSWAEADLRVYPNLEVEVKSSKLRLVNQTRQGFQFSLFRHGHSKRIHEPIVVLVCQSETPVAFVIPGGLIQHHNSLSIACHNPYAYQRKWSYFRERFDLLECAGAVRFDRGFVTCDRELFDRCGPAGLGR